VQSKSVISVLPMRGKILPPCESEVIVLLVPPAQDILSSLSNAARFQSSRGEARVPGIPPPSLDKQ